MEKLVTEVILLRETLATAFVKIDANFISINDRLDKLDKKVDALKGDTTVGFENVGSKIENLTEEILKIGAVSNTKTTMRI